ncbi:MAG: SAM-dependent methyltransferase [Bacteriovoracaceae bacterium]
MKGKLILIPTPIDEESPLELTAHQLLKDASLTETLVVVEELKEVRRRWLRWGLPRERVEQFIEYNEHNQVEKIPELIALLRSGKTIYLMSDCGLPAFCDPGTELVNRCHEEKIQVSATAFANSISLAVALSGFSHSRFIFEGFLAKESSERESALKRIVKQKETTIIMDTPYRLERLLSEVKKAMQEQGTKRKIFLGMDLNQKTEELLRGSVDDLLTKVAGTKREFILILGQ